jgi:hypothetical protein
LPHFLLLLAATNLFFIGVYYLIRGNSTTTAPYIGLFLHPFSACYVTSLPQPEATWLPQTRGLHKVPPDDPGGKRLADANPKGGKRGLMREFTEASASCGGAKQPNLAAHACSQDGFDACDRETTFREAFMNSLHALNKHLSKWVPHSVLDTGLHGWSGLHTDCQVTLMTLLRCGACRTAVCKISADCQ